MSNKPGVYVIPFSGELRLDLDEIGRVPTLHPGIPVQEVSIDLIDDTVVTTLDIEGEKVGFWNDPGSGATYDWNDYDRRIDGRRPWESTLDADQIREVLEWGCQVSAMADLAMAQLTSRAATVAVLDAIAAFATNGQVTTAAGTSSPSCED